MSLHVNGCMREKNKQTNQQTPNKQHGSMCLGLKIKQRIGILLDGKESLNILVLSTGCSSFDMEMF